MYFSNGPQQAYYGGQPYYGAAEQMLINQASRGMKEGLEKVRDLPERKIGICALISTIMGPWLIFVIVLYVRGMWIHYSYPALSLGLAFYFLIFGPLVAGVMAFSACKDPKQGDPRLLFLLFILCTIAWLTAWLAGDQIYVKYTQSYYDITNLNSYPSVLPNDSNGAQYMDAGIIQFVEEAKLNLTLSMGFKDGDTYCVAPVGIPDKESKQYDFWAVGINCCSGVADAHAVGLGTNEQQTISSGNNYEWKHPGVEVATKGAYRCGEFSNPGVHGGLRLMNDEQRPFFRLAVKEAEAAFNIKASHPVFLHWIEDPEGEAEAYQDDAFKHFMFGVFSFFGILVFIAIVAGLILPLLKAQDDAWKYFMYAAFSFVGVVVFIPLVYGIVFNLEMR